jgi:general nucleoside transport system ATP-binding protein
MTKRFGSLLALSEVSLDLMPGEIHCILGENGAGKSTLCNLIFGVYGADAGAMEFRGTPYRPAAPVDALASGIAMVHQHFSLVSDMTVVDNVLLGQTRGILDRGACAKRLRQLADQYGLPLDPFAKIEDLSVGERQRVEIVRALMQNPKLLILDEPTAVLTPQEADQLFIVLERLKSEGRAILYISHKLEEVKRLCDTATILRLGKKVATCNPRQETAASLARMMVGAEIGEVKATKHAASVPRLVIHKLSLEPDDPHGTRLKDISLEVRGGEVLGIAGVAGNGQDELFAALSGERLSPGEGNIVIDGNAAGLLDVNRRRRMGAAFVPEERLGHGCAPRMKLSENALLTLHAAGGMVKRGFINKLATLAYVDRTTKTFDVRKAKRDPEAVSLSGGNLQKFQVGREILREPGILVVSQPTWGVDAGAAATIRQALVDLAGRGSAVLVISQDLDELAEIADRIAVMFHGKLSAPLEAAAATRERLGLLMGGADAASEAEAQEAKYAVGA